MEGKSILRKIAILGILIPIYLGIGVHIWRNIQSTMEAVFPTGQVGQAAAKPSLAYGNSLGPGLARAYRLCKA